MQQEEKPLRELKITTNKGNKTIQIDKTIVTLINKKKKIYPLL